MQGCLFQNAQYVGGHIWGGYHLRYHVVTRRLAYSFSSSATLCLGNYDQRTDVRGQMWSVLTRTVSHSTRALSWYRWATTHLFLNKWSVHQSDLLSHRGLLGSLQIRPPAQYAKNISKQDSTITGALLRCYPYRRLLMGTIRIWCDSSCKEMWYQNGPAEHNWTKDTQSAPICMAATLKNTSVVYSMAHAINTWPYWCHWHCILLMRGSKSLLMWRTIYLQFLHGTVRFDPKDLFPFFLCWNSRSLILCVCVCVSVHSCESPERSYIS